MRLRGVTRLYNRELPRQETAIIGKEAVAFFLALRFEEAAGEERLQWPIDRGTIRDRAT